MVGLDLVRTTHGPYPLSNLRGSGGALHGAVQCLCRSGLAPGLMGGDRRRSAPAATPSLAEQVQQAEQQAWQSAYASHRSHVHSQLGVPLFPSRGRGDCLALVLLPFGLILLVVHPLPATLVLAVVGWLVLSGNDRFRREREAIRQADAEALRRWLAAGNPPPASGAVEGDDPSPRG